MNDRIELNNYHINVNSLATLSVVVGIVAGVIISFWIDREVLSSVCTFDSIYLKAASGKWLLLFASLFLQAEIWLAVAFVFGFGAVYHPLSLLLLMFRGLGLGACTRGVYLTADVFKNLAVFLPISIVTLALLVLQTREAIRIQSMYFSLTVTNENRIGLKREAVDYVAKFLIYSLILAIICMIECIIIRLFLSV